MSGVQVSAGASDSSAVAPAPPQQQLLQEVTVTQFSPEAVDEIITGEVVLMPPQQQEEGQKVTVTQFSPEAIDEIIRRYKAFPKSETDELDEMRGWFMMVATLTASITYSAALNPPGGFWQGGDAAQGRVPGYPVLRDIRARQYNGFFWCNLISFVSSLFIITILSVPKVFNVSKMNLCNMLVILDIGSLMGALTFGPTRNSGMGIPEGIFLVIVVVYVVMAKVIKRLKQNACIRI